MHFLRPVFAFLSGFAAFFVLSLGTLAVVLFGEAPDMSWADFGAVLGGFGAALAVPMTLGMTVSVLRPSWNRGILVVLVCLHLFPTAYLLWGALAPNSPFETSNEVDRSVAWAMLAPVALGLVLYPAWFWWFRNRDV